MTNNPTIDGVCETCLGSGKEYDGAGHTCTACNGLGGAPAVERQEPTTDSSFIRGWEVGAKLFRLRLDADKYIKTGQSKADGNGNKLEPLYRENHAPEVAALQSTIAQLQTRVQELESVKGEPFGYVDQPYEKWLENKTSGWATIWATDGAGNPSRGKPSVALFTALPTPVAVTLSDDQILDAMREHIYAADGGYVFDTAKPDVIAAGRALIIAVLNNKPSTEVNP